MWRLSRKNKSKSSLVPPPFRINRRRYNNKKSTNFCSRTPSYTKRESPYWNETKGTRLSCQRETNPCIEETKTRKRIEEHNRKMVDRDREIERKRQRKEIVKKKSKTSKTFVEKTEVMSCNCMPLYTCPTKPYILQLDIPRHHLKHLDPQISSHLACLSYS